MASENKNRRDEKKRKSAEQIRRQVAEDDAFRRRAQRSAAGGSLKDRPTLSPQEALALADATLTLALKMAWLTVETQFQVAVESLVDLIDTTGHRTGVEAVHRLVVTTLTNAWGNGWQPNDLLHVVGRGLEAEHRDLLVAAIGVEFHGSKPIFVDDHWQSQLDEIGVPLRDRLFTEPAPDSLLEEVFLISQVRLAIQLVNTLTRLPRLPHLMSPPGDAPNPEFRVTRPTRPSRPDSPPSPRSHLDDKILARVRGLLSKAESTTFEEEADALTAKAQELMARHAIDLAMVDAGAGGQSDATARRIHIDDPYVEAKSSLLSIVAQENRCTVIMTPHFAFCTVFGFDTDLDITELLFTSLLTQATSAMVALGKSNDPSGFSRTRSFRQSFLMAFAHRIGERLHEATKAATQAAQESIGDSMLPVLAFRKDAVDQLSTKTFPKTQTKKTTISNADGWWAGREAADRASLKLNVPTIRS
jgi:Protein of unknown function (DUF2786)